MLCGGVTRVMQCSAVQCAVGCYERRMARGSPARTGMGRRPGCGVSGARGARERCGGSAAPAAAPAAAPSSPGAAAAVGVGVGVAALAPAASAAACSGESGGGTAARDVFGSSGHVPSRSHPARRTLIWARCEHTSTFLRSEGRQSGLPSRRTQTHNQPQPKPLGQLLPPTKVPMHPANAAIPRDVRLLRPELGQQAFQPGDRRAGVRGRGIGRLGLGRRRDGVAVWQGVTGACGGPWLACKEACTAILPEV